MSEVYRDYRFHHAGASHMHGRFMPVVHEFAGAMAPGTRVLDVGSGSGYTCGRLLSETGFVDVPFRGAGRVPGLWMTMVMAGTRPAPRP